MSLEICPVPEIVKMLSGKWFLVGKKRVKVQTESVLEFGDNARFS